MTISELIVKLGFQVQGQQGLNQVNNSLTTAYYGSTKLLLSLGALNTGFVALMVTAANAAQGLMRFEVATGMSSERLQSWQHEAKQFGVAGDEMASTLKSIANARANLMLKGEGIAPWQFFGISANQSPMDVLRSLSQKFKQMDPNIARVMASQLGISDNMFVFLKQSNLELDRFNRNLLLTEQHQQNLVRLNKVWQDVLFSLAALKNRFAELFTGPAGHVLEFLKGALDLLGVIIQWLGRATPAATSARYAIAGLVGAIALLTVALTPGALELGVFFGALLGLFLLWEDFQAAMAGGQSMFDWGPEIAAVNMLAAGLQKVVDLWRELRQVQAKNHKPGTETMLGPTGKTVLNILLPGMGSALATATDKLDDLAAIPTQERPGASIKQENNINVKVEGGQSPAATGRAVGRSVADEVSSAAYQIPAPGY